jgi:hypothetical protein
MLRSQLRRAQKWRSGLIDGLVDALVTQRHSRFVGEPSAQMAADLLRTPPLPEQLSEQPPQLAVAIEPSPVPTRPTGGGTPMSLERAVVATGDRVAAQTPG